MDNYYARMKGDIGIDADRPDDEEHTQLEEAIKIIKPNMDPKTFIDMMKTKKIIHKDTANKAIIRRTIERNREAKKRMMGSYF